MHTSISLGLITCLWVLTGYGNKNNSSSPALTCTCLLSYSLGLPIKAPLTPLQLPKYTRECPTYVHEYYTHAVTAGTEVSLYMTSLSFIWIYIWYNARNTICDPANVFLISPPPGSLLIMPQVHWPSFCSSDTSHLLLPHRHCICCFLCLECSLPKPLYSWFSLSSFSEVKLKLSERGLPT